MGGCDKTRAMREMGTISMNRAICMRAGHGAGNDGEFLGSGTDPGIGRLRVGNAVTANDWRTGAARPIAIVP